MASERATAQPLPLPAPGHGAGDPPAASELPVVREPAALGESPHGRTRSWRAMLLRAAPLTSVLALSALLNTYALAQNGYANTFYSAAVASMLRSLHNFLFVSFDPGGLISVDKPPLALWLQTGSAKVFGFSPLALLLPEALTGVACVAALYWAMRRPFGRGAALAGALALAVFPAFVAVSRDNTPDPLLILLLILACLSALRACESGRTVTLLGCAALVGLAFNTKTLAAYLVVPPLALAFIVCGPGSVRRRVGQLALAGLVLAAVSLAWLSFVDLTPASQRPYVGGSEDNSELGLTFSYNGFGRVDGQEGTTGRIAYRPGASVIAATAPEEGAPIVTFPALKHGSRTTLTTEAGPTGPLRLLDGALGGQDGWLLPFALLSLLALGASALAALRRGALGRRDPYVAGLLVFGGWFVVEAAVLSFARGIVHPYYVSALAPPVAALVGAGAALLVRSAGRRSALALVFAAAILATTAAQVVLLERAGMARWLIPLLVLGAIVTVAVLLAPYLTAAGARLPQAVPARLRRAAQELRGRSAVVVGAMLGLLLVAPAAFAATTWMAPVQGTFPAAGPHAAAGRGGVGLYAEEPFVFEGLANYIRQHKTRGRFAVLTVSSVTAAPLILMGIEAASLGGYGGTDPAVDRRRLARLVARGEVQYVLLGGAYSERGGNRATAAVLSACKVVPTEAWGGPPLETFSLVLFDCSGHARGLATAPRSTRAVSSAQRGRARTHG